MNNVKNFINYGINRSITVKDLRKMPFGLSIFSLIEIIICLILGGGFLVVGFAVAVITLFVIAFVFIKTKHLTLQNYFAISGVLCLGTTINFILLAFILCCSNNYNLLVTLFIVLTPFIMMGMYFFINLRLIRNGVFEAPKAKYKKIKLYSMLGGIAGIAIARIIFSGMSQAAITAIIIVCIMVLASIISFGTINLYKLKLLNDFNYDENFK